MTPITDDYHLHVGALIYPRLDQTDLTGPFEVLARLPNSTFHIIGKEKTPLRDEKGLILTPEETIADAPSLDILVVPGGPGQQALMGDEAVLAFLRKQAETAKYVLSVCTGALLCGAAGLLKGRRCTTHWASFHLLEFFGGIPVNERVVFDGNFITTSGVTAGIDGALRLAAKLRGDKVAQCIQLYMEYAPEPPFNSGSPKSAPADVVAAAREASRELIEARLATARRTAEKLNIVH
jgi:cyclohexyl-isocyanide hydratase